MHVKNEESAPVASIASHAENLVILRHLVIVRKEFETFGKRGPATPPSGQGLAGELPSRQCNHCLKCLIGNLILALEMLQISKLLQ